MQTSINPSAFNHAMALLLERLELPPCSPPPPAYRLRFGAEPPVYAANRPGGWLELLTCVAQLGPAQVAALAPALLDLQLRQEHGPLLMIGMDKQNGKLTVRTRLRLAECRADDMVAALQALRALAAAVRTLVAGKPAEPGPAVGRGGARAGLRRGAVLMG